MEAKLWSLDVKREDVIALPPLPRIVGIGGNVRALVHEHGKLARILTFKNRFVLSGRQQLRDLLMYPVLNNIDNTAGFTPNYIALGTSGAASSDTQTTLGTEVFRKLISNRFPQSSGFMLQLFVDTSEANGNDIREVGLFTFAASGLLWARATHGTITKTSSVSITYEWTFTLAVP